MDENIGEEIAQHMVYNARSVTNQIVSPRKPKPVHIVESDDENTSDYGEIKTVDLNPDDEINAVSARKFRCAFSQQ